MLFRSPVSMLSSHSWPGRIRALKRIVDNRQPDLIHTTLFEATMIGRVAALPSHIPILTSLVNTTYEPAHRATVRSSTRLRIYQLVDIASTPMTYHFHAVSEAVKQSAIRQLHISPRKISVVPRGRDRSLADRRSAERRQQEREELGISQHEQLIVSVGRQEPQKGHEILIRALPAIVRDFPNSRVYIVGRGGNASCLLRTETAKLGSLANRVAFLGHRQDVTGVLCAADVFVFPSLYEGLGGAAIEALAIGAPVVASDLPALRELTDDGNAALLVPPGDPMALASAVAEVLRDESLQLRMITAGKEIFLSRYTLEHNAKKMAELYAAVAQRSKRSGRSV